MKIVKQNVFRRVWPGAKSAVVLDRLSAQMAHAWEVAITIFVKKKVSYLK